MKENRSNKSTQSITVEKGQQTIKSFMSHPHTKGVEDILPEEELEGVPIQDHNKEENHIKAKDMRDMKKPERPLDRDMSLEMR